MYNDLTSTETRYELSETESNGYPSKKVRCIFDYDISLTTS